MRSFFADSDVIDRLVLRPLAHIRPNWELSWDGELEQYQEEPDSFGPALNELIRDLERARPPAKYHDNEDRLAEYVRERLKWPIYKQRGRWVGADYDSILEQGGFDDIDGENLVLAASGRTHAAIERGQTHFDRMEQGHRRMLAAVLSVILYHRFSSSDR